MKLAKSIIRKKELKPFMPKHLKQLDREAYCSAPPLSTSTLHPPRLTREAEAARPRAQIHAPLDCKAEVSSLESVKFVADEDFDLKPEIKVELDPRTGGNRGPRNQASSIRSLFRVRKARSSRHIQLGREDGCPL